MYQPENEINRRQRRPYREPKCSADVLKWLGFACICLGTFSSAVVQRGIIGLESYSTDTLYEALKPGGTMMGWASLAVVTMLLSAMAIPIQAKLLYEGWLHTHNQKQYLLRLLGMAVVCEIPYDLAIRGSFLDLSVQNPIWALAIAVIMLSIFRQYPNKLLSAFVLIAACAWTVLLQSYMGMLTVVLVASFYFFSREKGLSTLAGVLVSCIQFPAPFGMFFVHYYDGAKGKTPRKLFYILYPLQLIVFAILAALIH